MRDKKHVAMITPGFLPVPAVKGGAVETLATYLLEEMDADGEFTVDVFSCSDEKLNNIKYKNVRIIQIEPSKLDRLRALWAYRVRRYLRLKVGYSAFQYALRRQVDPQEYDLVLFENGMRNVSALRYGRKRGIWVHHAHNGLENRLGDKAASSLRCVQRRCDVILTCSDYIKESFQPYVEECRLATYYNSVDLEHFKENKVEKKNLREKYGLHLSDFVLLLPGRVVPEKGVLEAIRAFSAVDGEGIKLVITGELNDSPAGDSAYVKKVRFAISQLSAKDAVVLTGFVDYKDMPYIYDMADCVLIPSQWEEPFGMVAVEAMAMGKPLIVTRSGGLTELVDETCAILIEKGDAGIPQLADGMRKLSGDAELAKRMGECGYARLLAHKEWHKENYLESFLKILHGLGEKEVS